MSILIFIIVLAVLIFAHELGHFLVAKWAGIRVDEFSIGFPPHIAKWRGGETHYSIGVIPFGGYVKIFGENPDEESLSGPDRERSFVNKSKLTQVGVLGAGVVFNIILAWLLISIGLMVGLPTSATLSSHELRDVELTLVSVLPNSPAAEAGLTSGDVLEELVVREDTLTELTVANTQSFIASHGGEPITVRYTRGEDSGEVFVTPETGVVGGVPAIGVSLDTVGILQLAPHRALWEGISFTATLTKTIAVGLAGFIVDAFTGSADLSQVAGPVGIVRLVGDASALGFIYLLSFTAIISIHLAIINLIPFPALDGGRILFVIIEALKRSPIRPKVANTLNTIGFALLIILMIVVTWNDIVRLLGN